MNQSGQQIQEVALRIREMRNIMGYSTQEMSIRTQVDEKTYVEYVADADDAVHIRALDGKRFYYLTDPTNGWSVGQRITAVLENDK